MSPRPSAGKPDGAPGQMRRRRFAIAIGLFAPIPLIWLAAATMVARGLQFPPALAYSTSGVLAPGRPAASDARPLPELLGTSREIALHRIGARPLLGWLAPATPQKAAVVLVCPNCVDAQAIVGYFRVIRSAGYGALILDYTTVPARNNQRQGRRYGFGWEERRDVLDAVAALRLRRVLRVAVLGVSAGAAAALFAGSEGAPIAAIISDSSYADVSTLLRRIPPLDSLNPLFDRTVLWEFGLMEGRAIEDIAPARAAARLDGRPLMVINGADDPLVPPADARRIFTAAHGPKELWIVPDAGHAAALAADPAQYTRRVGAFLTRCLGAPATGTD